MRGYCPTCGKPKDPKDFMDVMPDHLQKEAWLYVRHYRPPSSLFSTDGINQHRYYIMPSDSNEKLCRTNQQLHHLLNFKKACIKESDDLLAYIELNRLTVTKCSVDICAVGIDEEMERDSKIADGIMEVLKSIAPNLRQLNFTCDNNNASQQLIWRALEKIRFPSVTHAWLRLITAWNTRFEEDLGFTIDDEMFPMQAVLDIATNRYGDPVPMVFNPTRTRRMHIHDDLHKGKDRVFNKIMKLFVKPGISDPFLVDHRVGYH
jgi:hypothetical protein